MTNLRIGHGYDVHRLVPGRPLILGGVHVDYDRGLDGHSDADVLVTRRIQEALAPLGIRLADHIIVADDDYVSMAESGFLQR